LAESYGYHFRIVESVIEVNAMQSRRMADKVENVLGDLKGKHLAVLGLTFKPNTDDIRESPAIKIIRILLERVATVAAYDPAGMEATRAMLPDVLYAEEMYEAAEGADALILLTEWNQFRNLDWERIKTLLRRPVVFDLRNVYEPTKMRKKGFEYHCVGR
jgi:UDPglucose 6-dehydrogenase